METSADGAIAYDLADYAGMLRRRWWLIALGIVIGLAAGFVASTTATKSYSASTSVQVTPTQGQTDQSVAGGRTNSDLNLDTEAQLVKSALVADGARTLLRTSTSGSDLLDNVSVSVPANTSVLRIRYTASSPTAAVQGSHAFAQAYLDNRSNVAKTAISTRIRILQQRIAALNATLRTVAGQIATLPDNSPEKVYATSQQNIFTSQIGDLGTSLSQLEGSQPTPGSIISDAQKPGHPSGPSSLLYLAGGLLVGLLGGLLLAVGRDRSDPRLRRPADIERRLDLPVLVNVKELRTPAAGASVLPAAHAAGQSFRRLRNTLVAALPGSPHTILVAGVSTGRSTSLVAANLAAALCRSGHRAALVCATPGSLSPRMLHVGSAPGLAEVLAGDRSLTDASQRAESAGGLTVLSPGAGQVPLSERLQGDGMGTALADLRRDVDFVIIESPATSQGAEAQGLAAHADAVLLVVELGRSRREEVLDAARQLDGVGAEVLGAVVVPHQRGGLPPANAAPRPTKDAAVRTAKPVTKKPAEPTAVDAATADKPAPRKPSPTPVASKAVPVTPPAADDSGEQTAAFARPETADEATATDGKVDEATTNGATDQGTARGAFASNGRGKSD